jgi:hypothetical protein
MAPVTKNNFKGSRSLKLPTIFAYKFEPLNFKVFKKQKQIRKDD